MRKPTPNAARTIAAAVVLASLSAMAGVVACSLIVNDKLPAYMCAPNVGRDVCPRGEVCTPNASGTLFMCAPPCTPTSCGASLQCDPLTGFCVPPDGGGNEMMGADDAPPGVTHIDAMTDAHDAGALGDVDAATSDGPTPCRGFGCACTTSADCPPRFACAGKIALTADIWGALRDAASIQDAGDAGICVEPCCISGECEMDDGGSGGQVCFATGAGGSYCVPPSLLGDRTTLGTALGGTPCPDGDGGVCRSGLCASGMCADTCCSYRSSSVECANGSVCRFSSFPGGGFDTHLTAHCTVPGGGRVSGGNTCAANSECRSNLCSADDGGSGSNDTPTCRDACRNAADCTIINRSPVSCGYFQPSLPTNADLVAACMPSGRVAATADGGVGSSCQTASDCARGYCAPLGNGRSACLAPCFIDRPGSSDDCLPTERCRPQLVQLGGVLHSVLACGM